MRKLWLAIHQAFTEFLNGHGLKLSASLLVYYQTLFTNHHFPHRASF
jgi:hypothetical protein